MARRQKAELRDNHWDLIRQVRPYKTAMWILSGLCRTNVPGIPMPSGDRTAKMELAHAAPAHRD